MVEDPALSSSKSDRVSTWQQYNIEQIYLTIGSQHSELIAGFNFDLIEPGGGKPSSQLSLFALVTVFQYAEGLTDRQAAEALSSRLDWKYALCLPFDYPGILPEALCEFRQSLLISQPGRQLLGRLMERLAKAGLLNASSRRMAPGELLAAICCASRAANIMAAMGQALEQVAASQPEWLRELILPHWYTHYRKPTRTTPFFYDVDRTAALIVRTGKDAWHLLDKIQANPPRALPAEAIDQLARICRQQFQTFQAGKIVLAPFCANCRATGRVIL